MNGEKRIYHVVTFTGRRLPHSFCGQNAKRDANAMAKREGGSVKRMTGAQWAELAERSR